MSGTYCIFYVRKPEFKLSFHYLALGYFSITYLCLEPTSLFSIFYLDILNSEFIELMLHIYTYGKRKRDTVVVISSPLLSV